MCAKKNISTKPSTWEQYRKDFLRLLPSVSSSYDTHTIFGDVCRAFSLSLQSAVTIDKDKKADIEGRYQLIADKYGKTGMEKVAILFSYVVEALECKRSDFLGHIYEDLNATKSCFSQYFTPDSISRLMARVTLPEIMPDEDRIITVYDPTCGAGALLIEAAEEFVEKGGKQGNLLIRGDDIDETAADIAYVQMSLLGYPAIVSRMDTLAMKVHDGPWYTIGYFMHGIPMRLLSRRTAEKEKQDEKPQTKEISQETINVRQLIQQEFELK